MALTPEDKWIIKLLVAAIVLTVSFYAVGAILWKMGKVDDGGAHPPSAWK